MTTTGAKRKILCAALHRYPGDSGATYVHLFYAYGTSGGNADLPAIDVICRRLSIPQVGSAFAEGTTVDVVVTMQQPDAEIPGLVTIGPPDHPRGPQPFAADID